MAKTAGEPWFVGGSVGGAARGGALKGESAVRKVVADGHQVSISRTDPSTLHCGHEQRVGVRPRPRGWIIPFRAVRRIVVIDSLAAADQHRCIGRQNRRVILAGNVHRAGVGPRSIRV